MPTRLYGGLLAVVFLLAILMGACGRDDDRQYVPSASVGVAAPAGPMAGEGLNLKAVARLVLKGADGDFLAHTLNEGGLSNLDLDVDRFRDRILIDEYGTGMFRGYSLVARLTDESIQPVAEVRLNRAGGYVTVEVEGNANVYGPGYFFSRRVRYESSRFFAWAFGVRPMYVHRPVVVLGAPRMRVVPMAAYQTRVTTVVPVQKGVTFQRTKTRNVQAAVSSPNKGKSSPTVRASLANPTATQRKFRKQNPAARVGAGGFGQSKGKGIATTTKPPPTAGAVGSTAKGRTNQGQSTVAKPNLKDATGTQRQFRQQNTGARVGSGGLGKQTGQPAAVTPAAPAPAPRRNTAVGSGRYGSRPPSRMSRPAPRSSQPSAAPPSRPARRSGGRRR